MAAALAFTERVPLELLEQRERTLELEAAEALEVTAARREQQTPRAERTPAEAVEATEQVGDVARHLALVVVVRAASYGVRGVHSHPRTLDRTMVDRWKEAPARCRRTLLPCPPLIRRHLP